MQIQVEDRIRVAAYLMWRGRGSPPNAALDCWLVAERQVLSDLLEAAERKANDRMGSIIPSPDQYLHPTTMARWNW